MIRATVLNLAADVAALCNEAELVEKHHRGDDGRRGHRITFNGPISVYACNKDGRKVCREAYSLDISRCGMGFVSPWSYPEDSYVVVGVPSAGGAVMLPARVATCKEVCRGIHRVGVAFCLKARQA